MGGRYAVSGAQLGVLIALLRVGESERALVFINEICEHQFLGDSQNPLHSDIEEIARLFYPVLEKNTTI